MTIKEFIGEIKSKKPPIPKSQLEILEKAVGTKLPDDYRRFLINCNGGYVGGRFWFQGRKSKDAVAEVGINHIGGFRKQTYFSLAWARETYAGRIPKELLWIMDDPFGNAICLGINGRHREKIYFWDHENEPDPRKWNGKVTTAGNIHRIANSFSEFVAGLQELSEELETSEPDDTEAERRRLRKGKLPTKLASHCRRASKEFPEVRDWVRLVALKVFDKMGSWDLWKNEESFMLLDFAVWLDDCGRLNPDPVSLNRVYDAFECWMIDNDDVFGFGGYNSYVIQDWWKDRIKKGMLKDGRSGVRFTSPVISRLLKTLRAWSVQEKK